ncbi:MAG: hypothetical protein EOO85_24380, partial [Pedobacter sp.]
NSTPRNGIVRLNPSDGSVDLCFDPGTGAQRVFLSYNGAVFNISLDSNNNILENGDTVVIIKTLDVKGSSLSAKLGTVVKNIKLVEDNKEQIEGRIEGQLIVILTKYIRKQN